MTDTPPFPERAALMREYAGCSPYLEGILANLANELRSLIEGEGLSITIKFRVKSFESYYNKLLYRLRNRDISEPYLIRDILGIRVICPFINDTYWVEKIIRNNYSIIDSEKKGIQLTFKEFGYEATHLVVLVDYPEKEKKSYIIPEGCEIQISTTLQDAWAEVEHELVYKSALTPFDIPLKRKLAALNATLTLSDIIFQEIRDYHRSIQEHTIKRRDDLYDQVGVGEGHDSDNPVPGESPGLIPGFKGPVDDDNETLDSMLIEALASHNSGNFHKAIELYTYLLSSDDNYKTRSVILNHRGLAYVALSDYERAVVDFSEAVKIDARNFRSYNHLAICMRMSGDYESALKYLDDSLEINPYQAENYYFRALILFDLGDYHKSIDHCDRALNFKPDNETFVKFRDLVRRKIYTG